MTATNFKRYFLPLGGDTQDDAWTGVRSGTPRSAWFCDAEADLPTGSDASAVSTGDWAFALSEGTFWKRGASSWSQVGLDTVTGTFTIGVFLDGNGATLATGVRPIWRAPFACTVTGVRGYVDTGTTTVINAGTGATSAADFCSSDITINPSDAWEDGTVNQNTAVSAGDTVSVEVVTAGTATQITIQVDLTRP